MALITIVVPVYKVQPYLRECLDSILEQPFSDIEVIAVDDCTPDDCGRILDEYAARDQRVTAIHLPKNVGLGGARNAGLTRATGDYVWFVDSDDVVASGALERIAKRLSDTSPDVLIVDYARRYWSGKTTRNKLHKLLSESNAPSVFRITERMDLLRIFPCAWNKVVRREFMIDAGLTFPSGWYEDLPFTYPLLAKAERVSVLDRVCYYYRQRRHGAILGTTSERHTELVAQYDLAFERLRNMGARGAAIEPTVFGIAMHHLMVVLDHRRRLPRRERPKFFREIVDFRRRHLPARGYALPPNASRLRQRFLAWGIWPAYAAVYAMRTARSKIRKAVKVSRRFARKVYRRLNRTAHLAYYAVQRRLPIDRDLAVYGAYWGIGYACNPAAIYESAKQLAPSVHGVWSVKGAYAHRMPADVDYVVEGSWRYFKVLARGNWFVNNVNFGDHMVKRPSTIHVQTHHGTTLKSMGVDNLPYPLASHGMDYDRLLSRCDRWDFCLSSNSYSTEIWARAYPCSFETLEYGYPRNDVLVNATPAEIQKIRASLGLKPDQFVVLYAPTHRDYSLGYRDLLDLDAFADHIGRDAVVLKRAHYFYLDEHASAGESARVIDVSEYPRVEDLYLAADVLITDYSSVMFDYATLDRPIVIYAPDWEAYRSTRGTYFDLLAEPPGAVARSADDLFRLFNDGRVDTPETTAMRAVFRQKFCSFDDGRAAQRVVRRVMLKEAA
ncbi:MAG TPA: bifunctional glycosyltransferase family 2 protein/CDP-glycerol:glycerophosphate glycerophosphotransferase [Micromonosporaceae bacterium]|nr:bifunctional glycosyltransferase family 2 protein/CDP-glycerol:glycerophosphate glycerophosphotransferase [Micromonosporaceae bacterium]